MADSKPNLRNTLHSAFAFVRSVEANRATASLTLDHMIQEQIEAIEVKSKRDITVEDAQGKSISKRISKLDRLENLKLSMDQVVKTIIDAGDNVAVLTKIGVYEVDQEEFPTAYPSLSEGK